MSIIGGFYSFSKNKCDTAGVYNLLKEFSLLTDERRDDDDITVFDFACGYLFAKKKKGVRSLISAHRDCDNNVLLVLGFLTHSNWQDWDFESSTLKPEERYSYDYGDRLTNAEGEFTAVFAHNNSGRLEIVNDRFGARPLYYSITEEGFYFCSNLFFLTRLCRRRVEPDPIGMMQMFYYTNTAGKYTHIKGFNRLPASTHLIIDGSKISSKAYYKLKYEPDLHLDPLTHAKTIFSQFCKGVEMRAKLSARTLLSLSGGLDSRVIAACLKPQMGIPTLTLVSEQCFSGDQCAAAEQVAKSLALKHSNLRIDPVISRRSRDIIHLTGGSIPLQHSAKSIQGPFNNYDIVLDGGPGDVLVGSYVPSMYAAMPKEKLDQLNTYYNFENSLERFSMLFNKEFLESVRTPFADAAKELIGQLDYSTFAEGISLGKMIHRQPAYTFAQPPHSHPYGTSVYPHLDYKYVEGVLKLPPLWLYNKQFYKYMIYNSSPELRNIPYANTGEILNGRIGKAQATFLDYKLFAAKRRLKAFYGRVAGPARTVNESMLNCYNVQNDKALLKELKEMLLGYSEMALYFNKDEWIKYIDRFEANEPPATILVSPDHPVGFLAAMLYTHRYTRE